MTAIVKKNALFMSGFFLFVITRIGYLLFYKGVADPYGYFEKAMIQAQDQKVSLTSSGIAFAYTGSLSKLFLFVGNRMEAVVGFHFVLQTAAFVLIVCGCALLFGRMAAYVSSFVMAVLPYLIISIGQISPDNYLMFYLALLFFMMGVFYKITRDSGWYRNNRGELYLILLGFVLGMVCIWHGIGLFSILVLFAVLWANRISVKERMELQQNVWEMERLLKETGYIHKEKEEVMPVSSQIFVLFAGIFLGGYATLMKYTGVTGNFLPKQFTWWIEQLIRVQKGMWQDVSIRFLLSVGGLILMSGLFGFFGKKKQKEAENICVEETREEKNSEDEQKPQINYIENPLPLPKKHVKKTMNFDLEHEQDDFDLEIDAKDDFDV